MNATMTIDASATIKVGDPVSILGGGGSRWLGVITQATPLSVTVDDVEYGSTWIDRRWIEDVRHTSWTIDVAAAILEASVGEVRHHGHDGVTTRRETIVEYYESVTRPVWPGDTVQVVGGYSEAFMHCRHAGRLVNVQLRELNGRFHAVVLDRADREVGGAFSTGEAGFRFLSNVTPEQAPEPAEGF